MFLDGPDGRPTSAVHLLFAGEPVRVNDEFRVITLTALVQMKLTSLRDKDRTHLRDLIGVGLLDSTWPARLPPALAARLQELLDNPNG
jgi:hypothetical protein